MGRWLASGFFFVVAGGTAYMAWGMFHAPSPHSDTAASVWIAMAIFLSALTVGAVIGCVWVWHNWPHGSSSA